MTRDRDSQLRDLKQWIHDSTAEAERALPDLLDLPGPAMARELARRPDLRPGVLKLLLPLLRDARAIQPERVLELTGALVADTGPDVAPPLADAARYMNGRAWTAHAAALHTLGRNVEAREAIGVALDLFRREPDVVWDIAVAEAVEAEILHSFGERAEALRKIRGAAAVILQHGDPKRYVEARMTESWMLLQAGDNIAAADVWRATADEAGQRGDPLLSAYFLNSVGRFHLRRSEIEAASKCFATAELQFRSAGRKREAGDARRNAAEADAARGDLQRALFGYYHVRDVLLETGDVIAAAILSARILDLLFLQGEHDELLKFITRLIEPFVQAKMRPNAMRAWAYLLERAACGELTQDDIAGVRDYFQRLPLRPNAPFHPTAEAER